MKRFTETTKWNDPWYRKLPMHLKLLWQYVCDNCDAAGVLDYDAELAATDYDALTNDEKAKHRLVSATLGAVAICTGTKAQHRLEQQARSSAVLDIGSTLKLFASTNGSNS